MTNPNFCCPLIQNLVNFLETHFDSVLSTLTGGLGVVIGAFITDSLNRRAKFEETNLQFFQNKHQAYNRLWDRFVFLQSVIINTPDFPAVWHSSNQPLVAFVTQGYAGIQSEYLKVNYLMSEQMGILFEYLTRAVVSPNIFGPFGVPKSINSQSYEKMKAEYDKCIELMMRLIKIECNAEAIEGLLYMDMKRYKKAMRNYRKNLDEFVRRTPDFQEMKEDLIKNHGLEIKKI